MLQFYCINSFPRWHVRRKETWYCWAALGMGGHATTNLSSPSSSSVSCHSMTRPKCLGSDCGFFFTVWTLLPPISFVRFSTFILPFPTCNRNNHFCFLGCNSKRAEMVFVLFMVHIKCLESNWHLLCIQKRKLILSGVCFLLNHTKKLLVLWVIPPW